MYIREAISYQNAWDKLQDNQKDFLALNKLLSTYLNLLKKNSSDQKSTIPQLILLQHARELEGWSKKFQVRDMNVFRGRVHVSPSEKVFCCFEGASTSLVNWLHNDLLSIRSFLIEKNIIPIFIFRLNYNEINASNFDLHDSLQKKISFNPNLDFPILFLTLSEDQTDYPEIKELDFQHNTLETCITFEPEYYQAGLSILNYFGSVLNEKYPEENATVKISQNGLNVKMTVETATGNTEVIEQALHEYELVLKGKTKPENFYQDIAKVIELKNQLRITEVMVDSQKDIIALQKGTILGLNDVIDKVLNQPKQPIHIHNQLSNVQNTTINHKNEINKTYDVLDDLIGLTDNESLKSRLAQIQNALEIAKHSDDPDEVKESGGMKKLAKFLKEVNETGSQANELAEKGGEIWEKIKSLGRGYNSIAQWCALPIIPEAFIKEKEVSKDE